MSHGPSLKVGISLRILWYKLPCCLSETPHCQGPGAICFCQGIQTDLSWEARDGWVPVVAAVLKGTEPYIQVTGVDMHYGDVWLSFVSWNTTEPCSGNLSANEEQPDRALAFVPGNVFMLRWTTDHVRVVPPLPPHTPPKLHRSEANGV